MGAPKSHHRRTDRAHCRRGTNPREALRKEIAAGYCAAAPSQRGGTHAQPQALRSKARTADRLPETEDAMNATGLDVFDKTLHTTNHWLEQIMVDLGPDRQIAWRALGAVLHTLRDRLTLGLAVHLGAQLPMLVRGLYYDQWHPSDKPLKERTGEDFLKHVQERLAGVRPINVTTATQAVFGVLDHYIDPNQLAHMRDALPEDIRRMWPSAGTIGRRHAAA